MAVTVGTSMMGLNALANNQKMLEKLTERLATGRRVNQGSDDPAALAISEQLSAESRMLGAARGNIDQGQSVLQIAEGALSTQQDLLSRAKELAVQAANGILGDQQRATLNAEFRSVIEEIDRIGGNTTFNGLDLLGGTTPTPIDVQVGIGDASSDSVDISLTASTADSLGGVDPGIGGYVTLDDLDISTSRGANTAMGILASVSDQVSSHRASIGAVSERLDWADRVAAARIQGTEAARGRLVDLDVASAVTALENARSLGQLGAKALSIQQQQHGTILDLLV